MRCGTTPIHIFKHKLNPNVISKVRIIYSQNDQKVLVKEDCTVQEDTITVKLTQEDTLKFDYKKPVEIQVRVLTVSGDCPTSAIKVVSAGRCLDDGVLK